MFFSYTICRCGTADVEGPWMQRADCRSSMDFWLCRGSVSLPLCCSRVSCVFTWMASVLYLEVECRGGWERWSAPVSPLNPDWEASWDTFLVFFSLKVFMKLFNLSWHLKTVHLSFFFLNDFEVVVFKRNADFKRDFCLLPVNLFVPFSFCCILFTSVLIIILPLETFVICPPFLLNAFSTVYSFIHLPFHSFIPKCLPSQL